MHSDRIRVNSLLEKVVSAEEAARFIKNGMTIGMSGFTRAGEAKAVPLALAERAAHEELKITLMTGASLRQEPATGCSQRGNKKMKSDSNNLTSMRRGLHSKL